MITFRNSHLIPMLTLSLLLSLLMAGELLTQVPHPADVFGFNPGDDYKLATYDQMLDYYKRLDAASARVQMREIGKSTLGKPLLLLFISSEENLKQLDRWRSISEQLARARIDEETAHKLVKEGKSITWIDGGLHATEVAHAQMTTLLAHKVATEETAEMQSIRANTILLLMPVMNPDGLDIVASWYKQNLGTPFETTRPPWLYHFYVGHDNNRDWFMNNMLESKAVSQVIYQEWYPQIVYNHHQTGPNWTRIFLPPFADPVNPNIHPGVTTSVNLVGSAMANRFAVKKMPGVVSDVVYSMWWNGGMRTVPYFHNMIGILTETSHATPTPRFFEPDSLPKTIASRRGAGLTTSGTNIFYPDPWKGGKSQFREPIKYMLTASMAVLKIATDLKEQWLYNIYSMGRDAIARGETEEPYAYVIPKEQWNSGEELNLINVLLIGGVEVQKATKSFKAGEQKYPAGSYVVYTAQAFRPYLVDLLEKQQYPDRRRTPNGPPEPPYDLAGWTLPLQMGVNIDRIDSPFDAPTVAVAEMVSPESGKVSGGARFGYLLSHRPNASILAVNRLLNDGEQVFLSGVPVSAKKQNLDAGTFVIKSNGEETAEKVADLSHDLGLDFWGIDKEPSGKMYPLQQGRIGIYKSWVSNMDEGWTRWLLNEYEFAADTLHDADIRKGDLRSYSAIILPHQSAKRILNGHTKGTMPEQYTGGLGIEGAVALKRYIEAGGTVVALDAANDFAIEQFGLPVQNVVSGLSSKQFFIPGSLVKIAVETEHPLAYGMQPQTAASFNRSRAFKVVKLSRKGEGGKEDIPEAPSPAVEIIARYEKKDLLMSGWALGEEKYIGGKAAMMRVGLGKGDVILIGFRPQFRGQPRGTYKLLFNSLLGLTLDEIPAGEESMTETED